MIHEGVGSMTNKEEAVKWIRLAAEQGHAEAQTMLNNILIRNQANPNPTSEPNSNPWSLVRGLCCNGWFTCHGSL